MITAERYHDISCGHRVHGHENKCRGLHGHNYRVTFTCAAIGGEGNGLDQIGRVIDFSVIKSALCMWLEAHWDHKMLIWKQDPVAQALASVPRDYKEIGEAIDALVVVPFNPTAENMAEYLLRVIGPQQLLNSGVELIMVKVEETRKCSATAQV